MSVGIPVCMHTCKDLKLISLKVILLSVLKTKAVHICSDLCRFLVSGPAVLLTTRCILEHILICSPEYCYFQQMTTLFRITLSILSEEETS